MTDVINGYHGGFLNNIDETQLQECSENEIKDTFKLNNKASLKSDEATINYEVKQSIGPGNYSMDNMNSCECGLETARNVQLSQPNINFNAGYGWMGEKGCLIEKDSELRKDELTNKRYINQLKTTFNSGYFGKGPFNVDVESVIRDSLIIKEDRSCGPLSGSSTLDYSLTPMIDNLTKEVQNPIHIIPEDSNESWVRGGLPTRQIMRNKEYMERLKGN